MKLKAVPGLLAKNGKDEESEDAEAKPFWDDFINVFGRRRVATLRPEKTAKKFSCSSRLA